MIDIGPPPKFPRPAIILPRPAEIIRPGDPRFVVPNPREAGFVLTPLGGFGAGSIGGAVITTVIGPVTLDSTEGSWGSYSFVFYMANANLLAGAGGCEITQIIFQAPAGSSLFIDKVYVGHRASSGDVYDFQSTPTKFQNGGSDSATLSAGTTGTWTGSYTLPASADPMVAFESTSVTHRSRATQTGAGMYYKSGTGDTGTVDKSSYNNFTATKAVLSISEIKALV